MNCIFCKIIKKEIPAEIVFENEIIIAFKDVSPATPKHILIVPKIHIESANEITKKNLKFISNIFEKIPEIAKNIGEKDYRIVNNCGEKAGQTVGHIHFHLMAGRDFSWPPG